MRPQRIPLLALLAMAAAATAAAQTRPLLTEEADTGGGGVLRLEAGADFLAREPSFLTGAPRNRWDAPVLRLTYSPAANVELDLEWGGRVVATRDPILGDVSDWGDATLRAKVRFAAHRDGRTAFGARLAVTLPETSQQFGLGPNTLRVSVELLLSQSLGRLRLHANAGLALQDEVFTPHSQNDFLAYGLAAVFRLGSAAELVAEASGLAGPGSPGADKTGEARAGVRLGSGRLRFDAAARHGLHRSDGEWGATAGLTFTLRTGARAGQASPSPPP